MYILNDNIGGALKQKDIYSIYDAIIIYHKNNNDTFNFLFILYLEIKVISILI